MTLWCVAEISKDGKVNPISPHWSMWRTQKSAETNYWQKKNTEAKIFRWSKHPIP